MPNGGWSGVGHGPKADGLAMRPAEKHAGDRPPVTNHTLPRVSGFERRVKLVRERCG